MNEDVLCLGLGCRNAAPYALPLRADRGEMALRTLRSVAERDYFLRDGGVQHERGSVSVRSRLSSAT